MLQNGMSVLSGRHVFSQWSYVTSGACRLEYTIDMYSNWTVQSTTAAWSTGVSPSQALDWSQREWLYKFKCLLKQVKSNKWEQKQESQPRKRVISEVCGRLSQGRVTRPSFLHCRPLQNCHGNTSNTQMARLKEWKSFLGKSKLCSWQR